MDRTSVYKYPADYAIEHGEIEQYRASYKANMACKNAIEETVNKHYENNCLDGKSAVREVVKQFGFERMLYVLAVTVRHKVHDGRISQSNKDWAHTVTVFKNQDTYGGDLNAYLVVDNCHTGLTDLFITAARHEHLLSLSLTVAEIKTEAVYILGQFQDAWEPNSPGGTHFMAQVSENFIDRAKTKDIERLTAILSFPSLELTAITGRQGVYALISKEEDRFRGLKKLKPAGGKQQELKVVTKP